MAFNDVFGGSSIYPSNATYVSLVMAANVDLSWPIEQQIGGDQIVADIIDLNASVPGLSVTIPDARNASQGFTALFNNVGVESVAVRNATGGIISTVAPGSAWQIYLVDNSTEAGTWRTFQYGASVSVVNAAALVGNGLINIGATLSLDLAVTTVNVSPLALDANSRARLFNWTGAVGAVDLPNAATVGGGWFAMLRNSGTADQTITPAVGTIDGAASKTLAPGSSLFVVSDGTNYITLISNGGGSGGFNLLSIDVSGGGDYTLAGVQLNQIGYRLTGVLTANRNIIVPATVQQYWVSNETTGAFSLTVKTAAGTGIIVAQGVRTIAYCDGTNVVSAENQSSVTLPLVVAQGGTNATDAAGARTNLNVPTRTGGDASGTWPINISGAAATAAAATVAGSITGQGALATKNNVDNGDWNGAGTPLAVANGGTGATDAATARANLGVIAGQSGSFSGSSPTPTGLGSYTGVWKYSTAGNVAALHLSGSGTVSGSPTVFAYATALPAAYRPAQTVRFATFIYVNGIAVDGFVEIQSNGTVNVYKPDSSAFTAGQNISFSVASGYPLN